MVETGPRVCPIVTPDGVVGIPYRLQRRKGMRHLRVVVDESNEVILKVPYGISQRRAVAFLESQGEWILQVLQSMPPIVTMDAYLREHPYLSGWGRNFAVAVELGDRVGVEWNLAERSCRLAYPDDLGALEAVRRFAKAALPERVYALGERHGLQINRVTVRDQRTRWGSCSAHGTISLNWRIVLLPPELHDYIVLHELAHLTHLNHSRRYWALLAEYDPRSLEHDRAITRYSRVLMRLGRDRRGALN